MGSSEDRTNPGARWRIVTHTGTEENVGGMALTEAEAYEQLSLEEMLHRGAGWQVERRPRAFLAVKNTTVRQVSMRLFEPMEDV